MNAVAAKVGAALRQIVTGSDNVTHDFVRWLAVLSVVVALGLSIYAVVRKDQPFDLQAFGIGIGIVLTAAAAAIKLKGPTE